MATNCMNEVQISDEKIYLWPCHRLGKDKKGTICLYKERSNNFGGGTGGLAGVISGSSWNDLNGGEGREEV